MFIAQSKVIFAHGSSLSNNKLNISSFTSPLKLLNICLIKNQLLPLIYQLLEKFLMKKFTEKYNDIDPWLNSIRKLKNQSLEKFFQIKYLMISINLLGKIEHSNY